MHRGASGKLKEAAQALYERLPSAAEMESSGFTPEDFDTDPVEVWPENWPAFKVFVLMQTQWRVGGMGGYVGLDYNVLFHKMDRMDLDPDDYEQMEDDVREMEFSALSTINKKP